ncbi:ATP-binding protein (plasmid) [Cupriavidus sp. USMAA2-4]|uniref:ABC transporter ATP-binding protein n=1 Tax=Cupriavidus sp. USMAA2-4 TaxID=876364 RepID=UPI0008A70F04|nr:ABC transporter ATP-binding protein [Cupriavidus sp. USMAA2-4]AOY97564.1 ATP-binding protein [Cupriavidus sp. USMAA2-4]
MISFQNVSKSYLVRHVPTTVLDNVSFDVARGTALGICGANGAGKSTLMRLAAGVELPSAGRVQRSFSVSWPLGYSSAFQSSLTGADNTRFIARVYGKPIDDTLAFVNDFAELGRYFRMPVKSYSAGMSARLAFAVSLAVEFDCYLIDEITAAGDARFRQRCHDALRQRLAHSALMMVSHDAGTLSDFCNAGAVLHGGTLRLCGSVADALALHQVLQQDNRAHH